MSQARPSTSKAPYSKSQGQREGGAPRPRPGQGAARPPHHGKGKQPTRDGEDGPPSKGKDAALSLAGTILTAPPNLANHANLRKLDLSNCGLTSLSFVRDVRRTLTWLNVSGNNLRAPEAWDGVNELGGLFGELSRRFATVCPELNPLPFAVLNASNCQLTEIPSVVEVLHSLKALVITHNKLKTLDHVKGLAHLNTIGSLTTVRLSDGFADQVATTSRFQQSTQLAAVESGHPSLAQEDLGGPQPAHRWRSARPHAPLPPSRGQAQR